jgi:hypothetical protein
MPIPIRKTRFSAYWAIVVVWAKIQTKPSVVGIDAAANSSGTTIPLSVPNMNSSTTIAIGSAIVSPRARSRL